MGNTRIDVQLVSPASLLQHSLLRLVPYEALALAVSRLQASPSHSPTSALLHESCPVRLVPCIGAVAQVLKSLRTSLLAALQVPCFLVVALSLLALLMYTRAQRRTLLLDFALYKAPEECRASWERYYQGLEDYKVR